MYENKDFIKSKIIGWCHMAYFCIVDGFDDPPMYDYFDYFNFEGLDRKIIDDYVTQKEWRL